MSLGIVIKAPEGPVLAAESRVTITSAPQPNAPLIQVSFDNATKVFGFSEPNTSVGVVTYGLGGIGIRSPYSFVPEFEATLPEGRLQVSDFAEKLSSFFKQQWQVTMPADFSGPGITFVVAGFDEGEPYGKVFVIELPASPDPEERNPDGFGITWGGQREMVDRLIQGLDSRAVQIAQQTLGLQPAQVEALRQGLQPLQMQIPLLAMSLQDCVDLAIFFAKTTIEA
jgi:hypothetical protein